MVDTVSQPLYVTIPLLFSSRTGKSLVIIVFQCKFSHVQDLLFPDCSASVLPESLGLMVNRPSKYLRYLMSVH